MVLLWTMFVAGLLHGLGPDHLAALAALIGRDVEKNVEKDVRQDVPQNVQRQRKAKEALPVHTQRSPNQVAWLGVRFAIGHAATLLLLAGTVWWLGRALPDSWQQRLEQLGGVVLVFLGGWLLSAVLWRRVSLPDHAHSHLAGEGQSTQARVDARADARVHTHPHIHLGRSQQHRHSHVAWMVGGLLGFSGARALVTALPLVLASSLLVVVTRVLAFGVGIVLSMTVAGWGMAWLVGLAQTPAYARFMVLSVGSLSMALGVYWFLFAGSL